MPTLKTLKVEMERALKDPDLQAEIYARPLRKAGLLTSGGRGLNAPQVTVTDCANLLIAIMAPGKAIRAAETVRKYRSLALLHRSLGPRGRRTPRPQKHQDHPSLSLGEIGQVHYLGPAIELLLREEELEQLLSGWSGRPPEQPGLSLRLIGPTPAATLRLPVLGTERVLAYSNEATPSRAGQPGLVRAAEVYEDTFLAMGRVFRGAAAKGRAGCRTAGS